MQLKEHTEFELAILEHLRLVMVRSSASGLTRHYRAFTILSGRITDCTKKLARMSNLPYSEEKETIVLRGSGVSPAVDVAQALKIPQNRIEY